MNATRTTSIVLAGLLGVSCLATGTEPESPAEPPADLQRLVKDWAKLR